MVTLKNKNALLPFLFSLVLFASIFAGVADFSPKKNILIVNSNNYEDIIAGSVYAAQQGYLYAFVLTEAHGKYWEGLLGKSSDNILYYESSSPVYPKMGENLAALSKLNIAVSKQDTLWASFAKSASSNKAIVVGNELGSEAISAAPYAVIEKAGLYFASPADADSTVSMLLDAGKDVMVYGSIADSVSEQELSRSQVINSGSAYLDNSRLLSMYSQIKQPSQILFSSGKTFEAGMVNADYPIALVGRTEPTEGLLEWISASGVQNGLAISADSDISGSIASIKKETGLAVFAKLGQGFIGDSQAQPLAVVPIPGTNPTVIVDSVKYSDGYFVLNVLNEGNHSVYVRVSAVLPSAKMGSSQTIMLEPNEQKDISVNINVPTSGGAIAEASFQIYLGSDPYVVESIDVITFRDISAQQKPSNLSMLTNYTVQTNTQKYVREQGGAAFSSVVALVLMLVAAYLFMHHTKPGSHVVLSKGTYRRTSHKHSKSKRRGH